MLQNIRATFEQMRREIARNYLYESAANHIRAYPQMCCYAFDRISIAIFTDGRLDKEALDLLMKIVGKYIEDGLVLDVGANIGNHAAAFAERAEAVIAFEPHPITYQLLCLNLAIFPNATAYKLGASSAPATVQAISPRLNFGGTSISSRAPVEGESAFSFDVVPLDSLREIRAKRVALIKLDIEGHEHEALQGAKEILLRDQPIIVIEQNEDVIVDGTSPSVEFLRSVGYQYFYALDERLPWKTPQWVPGPLRKALRFLESIIFGPVDWAPEIALVNRLEPRAYPMLVGSVAPLL